MRICLRLLALSLCLCWLSSPRIIYTGQDAQGRPGPVFAVLTAAALPEAPSSSIRTVQPPGYHSLRFDSIPNGGWLYNRTHLLGSLFGGSDAADNLITGTHDLNQVIMWPHEKKIYRFLLDHPEDAVCYAVFPVYRPGDAMPRGLWLFAASLRSSALSILDYMPNEQPGFSIDYATGEAAEIQPRE